MGPHAKFRRVELCNIHRNRLKMRITISELDGLACNDGSRRQRSHVPKFGNWENENVPYTAYFENARNEKDKGAKMINPNDPEENPSAFAYGSHHVVRAPSFQVNTDTVTPPVARRKDERHDKEEGSGHHSSGSQKNSLGQQKSRSRTSTNTESGSDVSSSDRSLLPSNHHRTRSAQKKNLGEGGTSFPPPSPPSRVRNGSHQSDNIILDQEKGLLSYSTKLKKRSILERLNSPQRIQR
ncbi:hypothetical protein AQUCO_02800048v1 [Aquilegia coerulea]|uniref:RIN4 pathogenic type III effector avirulence factor Avr cleavage site domain-containing protein n=1 Tax=Aquilegia coerulea TaxID=218851 RepID=A0A2G5D3P6_AQUCA|nr:hypothetical protein AQUCO_02800048v1 [Aquilegia coerulea]